GRYRLQQSKAEQRRRRAMRDMALRFGRYFFRVVAGIVLPKDGGGVMLNHGTAERREVRASRCRHDGDMNLDFFVEVATESADGRFFVEGRAGSGFEGRTKAALRVEHAREHNATTVESVQLVSG